MGHVLALGAATVGVLLPTLMGCTTSGDADPLSGLPATSAASPQSGPRSSTNSQEWPTGRVVTSNAALVGKWRTIELYGRAVAPKRDRNGRPLEMGFLSGSGKWLWDANDGCNSASGRYKFTADGTFHAMGGVTPRVACPTMSFRQRPAECQSGTRRRPGAACASPRHYACATDVSRGVSCRPDASKFAGSSQAWSRCLMAGHSSSVIENHEVSRLRPLLTFAFR